MIRNIFWNLDGVLIDTYPAITFALSKAVNEFGVSIPMNSIDKLIRKSIQHCIDTLAEGCNLNPGSLRSAFVKYYACMDIKNQKPVKGAVELCQLVSDQNGINLLFSQHSIAATKTILNTHGLLQLFSEIFSIQSLSSRSLSALIHAGINKYHVKPSETLMIAHNEVEIKAALQTKLQVVNFSIKYQKYSNIQRISNYLELQTMYKLS